MPTPMMLPTMRAIAVPRPKPPELPCVAGASLGWAPFEPFASSGIAPPPYELLVTNVEASVCDPLR